MRFLLVLCAVSAAVSLCLLAADGAPNPPEFPFGVVLDPNPNPPDGEFQLASQEVQKLGLQWVRLHTEWLQVEAQQGKFTWTKYDECVDALHDLGINIVFQISGIPDWASDEKREQYISKSGRLKETDPEPRIPEFVAFLTQVMNRYKDRVKCWQIENETNSHKNWIDPPNFAAIMKAIYRTAKQIDPDCTVVLGGLAGNNDQALPYLRRYLQAGGGKYFDVIDFHCYKYISRISEQIPVRRRVLEKFGIQKPIWIVETGDPSDFTPDAHWENISKFPESRGAWDLPEWAQTQDTQASRIVERMVLARSVGVQRTFWFSFRAQGDTGTEVIPDLLKTKGLVDKEFQPKLSYYAYQFLIAKLAAAGYVRRLPSEKLGEAHLFSVGKHRVFVGWMWEGTGTLDVAVSGIATLSDKLGHALGTLTPKRGSVVVPLTESPVYVEWDE